MSTLFFVGLIFLAYYLISKDVFTINFDNFQQKRVFTTIDAEFIAALLAKIAKADDVVSEKEASYISNVLDMVCAELNDYSYRDHLKYIYNYHKDSDVKIFNLAMEFKIKRNLSIAECTSVIIYLLNLAYIDGTFKRTEREAIETVCDAFEINDRLKEKIFADFKREFYSTYNSYERDNSYNRQEQRHERHEEQRYYKATLNKDPYEILGLPKTASFDEIKKQYRKLAREYHPDFLGSSAEKSVISEATKKLQEINQAYEELKKKFGQ